MALDCIQISDLRFNCIIGVDELERRTPQEVIVDLELSMDLRRAGRRDDLATTVDYRELSARLVAEMSQTQFRLLEAFAERLADCCLRDYDKIHAVRVRARKPAALAGMASAGVAVVIDRDRDSHKVVVRTPPRRSR